MHNNGDRRATMRAGKDRHDDSLAARAAFCGRALKVAIAAIALAAVAAAAPALARADFPLTSLLIYAIGMGFIAMPLCLYYELLLKRSAQGAADVPR